MGNARPRILIVDDHADTAHVLEKLLKMSGFECGVALDGDSALQAVKKEHFDIALCDISLPDIDGCELLEQLQQLRPVKGIALTGYGMASDLERYRTAGFSEHLLKPFELNDLLAAIQKTVEMPALVP